MTGKGITTIVTASDVSAAQPSVQIIRTCVPESANATALITNVNESPPGLTATVSRSSHITDPGDIACRIAVAGLLFWK